MTTSTKIERRYEAIFSTLISVPALVYLAYLLFAPTAPSRDDQAWWPRLVLGFILLVLLAYRSESKNPEYRNFGKKIFPVTLVPLLLVMTTLSLRGVPIFESTCQSPTTYDHAWFVVDNMAKGALVDVLQSFHIDLFSCRPNKSFVTSCITLAIRSVTTGLVIFFVVNFFKWRAGLDRSV